MGSQSALTPCRQIATISSGVNLLVRIGLVLLASGDRGQLIYAMLRGSGSGDKITSTGLGAPRTRMSPKRGGGIQPGQPGSSSATAAARELTHARV